MQHFCDGVEWKEWGEYSEEGEGDGEQEERIKEGKMGGEEECVLQSEEVERERERLIYRSEAILSRCVFGDKKGESCCLNMYLE